MTVVELNVGGTIFTTTKTTLNRDPNSMLARMFDGDLPPCQQDQQGRRVLGIVGLCKAPATAP